MKYHIDKNGKAAICKATKRPCPLGGEDVHFDTLEEAEAYSQNKMQEEFGLMGVAKPIVKTESDIVKNLYVNYDDVDIDPEQFIDYETKEIFVDDIRGFEDYGLIKIDVQEYADDKMHEYNELVAEGKQDVADKLMDELGYNDWHIYNPEKQLTPEEYIYGGGMDFYLENTDGLIGVNKDGELDYEYYLVSRDELEDVLSEIEDIGEGDPRDEWNADYRKMTGF